MDHMVTINGNVFRCECGCNVLHDGPPHNGKEVFVCNACGTEYESERDAPSSQEDPE